MLVVVGVGRGVREGVMDGTEVTVTSGLADGGTGGGTGVFSVPHPINITRTKREVKKLC